MKFEHRAYSSNIIRPKPLIHTDQPGGLFLFLTPWGHQESNQKAMDLVVQHLMTTRQDRELTTPFQSLTSLSKEANDLRIATLLANDFLYRSQNSESYQIVSESVFLSIQQRRVSWCQMGCPHLLVKKKNHPLQPISCFPELKTSLMSVPFPNQFLGSEMTIAPRCGDLDLEKGDEIILISSSDLPQTLWTQFESGGLEVWTQALVEANGSQPFWLSRIQIDGA